MALISQRKNSALFLLQQKIGQWCVSSLPYWGRCGVCSPVWFLHSVFLTYSWLMRLGAAASHFSKGGSVKTRWCLFLIGPDRLDRFPDALFWRFKWIWETDSSVLRQWDMSSFQRHGCILLFIFLFCFKFCCFSRENKSTDCNSKWARSDCSLQERSVWAKSITVNPQLHRLPEPPRASKQPDQSASCEELWAGLSGFTLAAHEEIIRVRFTMTAAARFSLVLP